MIRSFVRWGPWGCGLVIACLVTAIWLSVSRDESLAGVPGLVVAIVFNLQALAFMVVLRPRMLASADMLDRLQREEHGDAPSR